MQLMIMKAMDMDEIIWGQSREKKGQKPKRTLISNDRMKKERLTNSTKKLHSEREEKNQQNLTCH